ncbi:MAG TPA: hypothetical protein VLE97_06375 [Gaiellaceae bacterium]|nr:hypothetical protein [Gaiellaceae bacterium]
MTHDYTMDDFREEMRRRGVYKESYPRRGRVPSERVQVKKLVAAWKPVLRPPVSTTRESVHGNTIAGIAPCAVHPLHLVKIRANGARAGCPMCEMQLEDLCRSFSSEPPNPSPSRSDVREHSPRIATDRTRIVGCSCGWRTPPGTPDSEEAYVEHVTVRR